MFIFGIYQVGWTVAKNIDCEYVLTSVNADFVIFKNNKRVQLVRPYQKWRVHKHSVQIDEVDMPFIKHVQTLQRTNFVVDCRNLLGKLHREIR